jgi:1-acyl-sn-glycerol-3-phosphate acyltransferase
VTPPPLPRRWEWLIGWFRWYVRRFLRKNFHAVRLANGSAAWPADRKPVVVVLNHPAWWDPLLATLLVDLAPDAAVHYAAIDAEAVQKYRVFESLGFFGVDTKSLRGAAQFLRTSEAILAAPNGVLWLTVQGRFADVRQRPLAIQPGVGHLAARLPDAVILPIALEYPFWDERTPEALVRLGRPLATADAPGRTPKEWTAAIEVSLTDTLTALNADAVTRDPARFTPLIDGTVGVGGLYDGWRRFTALARGRKFDPSHGGRTPRRTP